MAYRYCPSCHQWYQTHEYAVTKSGETVCKKDTHAALHGHMDGWETRNELHEKLQMTYPNSKVARMVDAAVEQGLVR